MDGCRVGARCVGARCVGPCVNYSCVRENHKPPPLLDTARGAGPGFQQAGAVLAGVGNGVISSPLMAERKKGMKFMMFIINSCFLILSGQLNIIKPIYPSMHPISYLSRYFPSETDF